MKRAQAGAFVLIALLTLARLGLASDETAATGLPPCFERPTYLDRPWTDGTRWCLERVIEQPEAGVLGFTALAAADDGTLYAARPLTGEVFALRDSDGDGLPETPTLAADGLTLPNALAWNDGALYIAGGAHIDRLRDGDLVTLADDVPSGGGFWTGGAAVGRLAGERDAHLYITTGAPCDACPHGERWRGAIVRYDLDGANRTLIATGLRHPADVALRDGVLWTVDTAPDTTPVTVNPDGAISAPLWDRLIRVETGADYGFPACAADCPAALTFPTHSSPLGLTVYTGAAFPDLNGALLVTLGGSVNMAHMQGYAVAAVTFDATTPAGYTYIMPAQSAESARREQFSLQHLNYRNAGIYPYRPHDVTVSREGWVYISVGDGRIMALRPLT